MLQAKLIEYAYPTSIHATKEGYGDTGCWFVALYPSIESSAGGKPVFHAISREDVAKYAESLPYPYNWMQKFN